MVSPSCFGVSFELLLVNAVGGVLVPQFKNSSRLINPKNVVKIPFHSVCFYCCIII